MTRQLSTAQTQALQMAANGVPVKIAARELGISESAARTRRRDAVRNLRAKTTPQAVAVAIGRGLINATSTAAGDNSPPRKDDK